MDSYFYLEGFNKFRSKMEDLDYVCDRQVTITHEDTEFIETHDVVSGGNRTAVILTVPSGNVILASIGNDFGYRYSLLGCDRNDVVSVQIHGGGILWPKDVWKGFCFEATSFLANVRLTSEQSLTWEIAEPRNIKRENISYTGLWDIYVNRIGNQEFSWWKKGKYVRPSERDI